ncbi:MAG TPA: hypothetical protein VGL40_08675 [Bacillota bacterium]
MDEGSLRLLYCMVCEDVRFEMNNKMSLMGCFDTISLRTFPDNFTITIVNKWWGQEGRFRTQTQIETPTKERVNLFDNTIEIREGASAAEVIKRTFQFNSPGTYAIKVLQEGHEKADIPLFVRKYVQI